MNLTLIPTLLSGSITPPPSKSQAHRMIIAAALSDGICHLENVALSADITATLACMKALGADASADGTILRGVDLVEAPGHGGSASLDCGESGSTLRFLIPVALALQGRGVFQGHGRLMERPQEPYFELFREKGIHSSLENGILTVEGTLTPGTYTLRGDVSSQFITGLLYALPLLAGDSKICLTTALESKGYVDMTLEALTQFGVQVNYDGTGVFHIPGGQTYHHCNVSIESDYSQAGFYCAANGLGSQVNITGLNPASAQGDRIILDYAAQLDGPGEVVLEVAQCPDLVPALALRAALRAGEKTRLVGAARLRIKESDRLETTASELNRLGGKVEQGPDSLTIVGVDTLQGGRVSSHNDHRIAMMLAMAATRASGPVLLEGAEAVNKSYPNFWEDYKRLGGKILCDM